jgi:archaellum component FlaD/FlaE
MATEDRVKVLEGEFKLIKSELRQTLGSVRDFLMDLKLPPTTEEPGIEPPRQENPEPESREDLPEEKREEADDRETMPEFPDTPKEPEPMPEPERPAPAKAVEDPLPALDFDADTDDEVSSGDIPAEEEDEQEQPAAQEFEQTETRPSGSTIPQVNLLANLVRWVSAARRELGMSQLPVFLDVYATTGNLSPEMKENILHLAEVATNPGQDAETSDNNQGMSEHLRLCMEINGYAGPLPEEVKTKIQRLMEILLQQTAHASKADIWSELLLDLHGILTGGCSSLRSILSVKQAAAEADVKDEAEDDWTDDSDGEEEDGSDYSGDIETDYAEPLTEEDLPGTLKGTRPARLRLVMPVGRGQEQELDLGNLFIASDKNPAVKKTVDKKKSIKSPKPRVVIRKTISRRK